VNYVIGDSHVSIFSGHDGGLTIGFPNTSGDRLPNFKTGNVSARLAYNFGRVGHPVTDSVDKIMRQIPKTTVIFSFGEIDCRCHANSKRRSMSASVEGSVSQYVKGLEEYLNDGFDVYALLPHVIRQKDPIDSAVGTWSQITAASLFFNTLMCQWNESRCISLFEWTLNHEIFLQPEYYRDDTHLNQNCLPFLLDECQKKGIEI